MEIYLYITFFFLCFCITLASVALSAYLVGTDRIKSKMLLESKRREKRLHNQLNLWQNAFVRKVGLGQLKPQPIATPNGDDKPVRQRIVPASEAIALQKQEEANKVRVPVIKAETVPPKIAENFIKDTESIGR